MKLKLVQSKCCSATCAGTKKLNLASSSGQTGYQTQPHYCHFHTSCLCEHKCLDFLKLHIMSSINWNFGSSRWGRKWQCWWLVGWLANCKYQRVSSRVIITQQRAPGAAGEQPAHTQTNRTPPIWDLCVLWLLQTEQRAVTPSLLWKQLCPSSLTVVAQGLIFSFRSLWYVPILSFFLVVLFIPQILR